MSLSRRVGPMTAILGLCLLGGPSPAPAQGLFQSFFGSPPPAAPPVARRPAAPPPLARPFNPPFRIEPREAMDAAPGRAGDAGSGSYRTLCVRMCDGYYWPISQSASRRGFYRDARACEASCGTEARLFYHHNSTGDVKGMVDLTGRAYTRLPNAFRYRKTLVEGCQCKPAPWADSELDRHRRYAGLAAPAAAIGGATATQGVSHGIEVIAGAAIRKPVPAPVVQSGTSPASESGAGSEPAAPAPAPAAAADAATAAATTAAAEPEAPAMPAAAPRAGRSPTGPARAPMLRPAREQPTLVRRDRPPPVAQAAAPTAKFRKPAPPGLFGLGAKPARWPGD